MQEIAWDLLSKGFILEEEAQSILMHSLNNNNIIVCAAAAIFLQHSSILLPSIRIEATQKIMEILKNDELSRQPLDLPDNYYPKRLDDILFETLKTLTE